MTRFTLAVLILLTFSCEAANSQDKKPSSADRIAKAAKSISNKQKYRLEYKLKKNETIRWTVEHVASTKTQMSGETEETDSRSVSIKAWKVSSVDAKGNMTFVHSIEAVNMWQKIGEKDPVAYNSKSDEEVPDEYAGVSDQLGKPLAVFSIRPNGQITDRKSSLKNARFGTGDVTVPLPSKPISIGYKWNVPTELMASDEDGNNLKLKARIAYQLMKVKTGNAYISFRTEVLTPVESQKVKSQIMQQMTKGYLVFDIAKGRPIRKEVEWDETVQGYEGPDSYLQYLGKMTEKIADEKIGEMQSKVLAPLQSEAAKTAKIKSRDDKPIIRK